MQNPTRFCIEPQFLKRTLLAALGQLQDQLGHGEELGLQFSLLRRRLILAKVRDIVTEEELACSFANFFIQRGLHLRRHAGPPLRNARS